MADENDVGQVLEQLPERKPDLRQAEAALAAAREIIGGEAIHDVAVHGGLTERESHGLMMLTDALLQRAQRSLGRRHS